MKEKIKTTRLEPNTPEPKKGFSIIILTVVGALLVILGLIIMDTGQGTDDIIDRATTLCIAESATLYATESCGYCRMQKDMFGTNAELLNIIDCDKDRDSCIEAGIRAFPTWIVDGEKYVGVKTEDQLKEFTKC